MNLRKFERELKNRQNEWDVLFTRISELAKTLTITVTYIGPKPNWFIQTFKFVRVRYFKRRLKILMRLAADLASAIRPSPQNIRINVR